MSGGSGPCTIRSGGDDDEVGEQAAKLERTSGRQESACTSLFSVAFTCKFLVHFHQQSLSHAPLSLAATEALPS